MFPATAFGAEGSGRPHRRPGAGQRAVGAVPTARSPGRAQRPAASRLLDAQALPGAAFKEYLAGIGDRAPSLDKVPVHIAWHVAEHVAEHVAARTVARLGCEKGTQSHPPGRNATR